MVVLDWFPTKDSLIAKWTNTDTRGLTGYSMKYYEMCYNDEENEYYDCEEERFEANVEAYKTMHFLQELQPGTRYQIEVTPIYGDLKGDTVSATGTTEQMLPQPTNLAAEDNLHTGASVSWEMQDTGPKYFPVVYYDIIYKLSH
jgi:hypothetical protein